MISLLMQQRQRWHAVHVDGDGYMLSALDVDGFVVHWLGTALLECVGWGWLFVQVHWLEMALLLECIGLGWHF